MHTKEAILRIRDHIAVHHIGEGRHIKIFEALCMAIEALEQMHSTEPLTPEEIKAIDYARVWISYGESGEWGIVVNGLLYSIDTLEGAGFVDMLQDAVRGEDVTRPTGSYKIYRWPSKEALDNG